MTTQEEFIDSCLVTGWKISSPTEGIQALLPPDGDPRHHWCAKWEKIPYKGIIVLVPHWAAPGGYRAEAL